MNNLTNISPEFREELYETSSIKKFNPGDVILDMDAYVNYIPVVLSGSLKVMRSQEDGREILLYYITPGESCIVSILSGMKQDKSQIRALVEEKAEILMVSIQKAKEWIRKFPEWTDFIFDLYQKRFEGLLNIVNSVAFQKVDARILQLLHQKAELYESNELVVTHQQIADELGITREAASRVLKQLENEEEIKLSRNKILLL